MRKEAEPRGNGVVLGAVTHGKGAGDPWRAHRDTYTGGGRGLQFGSPFSSKALRSHLHQSSITSPFPEHQYELIRAPLKA